MNDNRLPEPLPHSGELTPRHSQADPALIASYRLRSAAEPTTGDLLFDPVFLWSTIRHWWHICLLMSAVTAAASVATIWYYFKPSYRATAVMQIADRTPYLAFETERRLGETEDFVQTQIELLRSRLLLAPVMGDPEVGELPEFAKSDNPVETLMSHIRINRVGKSELYHVAFDSHSPQTAALIVNRVVDAYLNLLERDNSARTSRVVELLDKEKQRRAKEVDRLRERMRDLAKDLPNADLGPAGRGVAVLRENPLSALQSRLADAEVERNTLEAQIKAMEEEVKDKEAAVPEVAVELAVDEAAEVQAVRSQIATKRATLQQIESAAAGGVNDSSYRRLEREIQDLERSLARLLDQTKPRLSGRLKAIAHLNRKDELNKLRQKLTAQKELEQILKDRTDEKLKEANQSGNKTLELEFVRAELERGEKVFSLIAERSTALNTEMRAPGRVTLLEAASPPETPLERLPYKYMALAVLGCTLLSFGSVMLLEHSVRRIRDSRQLAQSSDFRVMGEVARLPLSRRILSKRVPRRIRWRSDLFEESIDSLRTSLLWGDHECQVRQLAVVSAVKGEGKTNVAVHLAMSLARSQRRPTLLIDADLRSPDIHQLFGIARDPGLCQVLEGDSTLDETIVTHWNPDLPFLHILPAGKLMDSPHTLLGGEAFTKVLAQLRERYEFVIIDSAPVLSAAETLVIAKAVDGVIMCTLRNRSREVQVQLAQERLLSVGARPMGIVFSAVPKWRYTYTYGSYPYRARSTST